MYPIINMVIKTRRNISGGGKLTRKQLGGAPFGNLRKKMKDKMQVSPCTTPHGALEYIIGRFNTYITEILSPPPDGVNETAHNKRISGYIEEFANFKRKAINLLVLFDPEFINRIVDPEKFGIARYNKDAPEYRIIEQLAEAINTQVDSNISMTKLTTLGDKSYTGQDDDAMKEILNKKETQKEYGINESLAPEERAAELWKKIKDKYIARFKNSGGKGAKEAARGIGVNMETPNNQEEPPMEPQPMEPQPTNPP